MGTLLEQKLTNHAIQVANAYFQSNIGLYLTRSDVASIVPGQLKANSQITEFAKNVINNMSPSSFCVPSSNGKIIELCTALNIPETAQQEPAVERFFPGSVTMYDLASSCESDGSSVPGCECDFSITCNAAVGLSGTLYYPNNGAIGDNCSCGPV